MAIHGDRVGAGPGRSLLAFGGKIGMLPAAGAQGRRVIAVSKRSASNFSAGAADL
jgi:hypothetical protein